MVRLGMDVEAVESVGRALKQRGDHVTAVVRAVDGLIETADAQWWGGRGREFVREWRTVHRPALLKVAGSVRGLGQSALNNASEQRDVSGSGGLATPGGGARGEGTSILASPSGGVPFIRAASGGDCPPGYERLDAADLRRLGLARSDLHDGASGFDAEIFTDGKGHYVVAFPGTDLSKGPLLSEDVTADAQGFLYSTKQSEQSAILAKTLCDSVGADNVTLVGHSLGGRNAAIGSIASGAHAITYNAAGVNNSDVTYAMMVRGDSPSLLDYAGSAIGLGAVANETTRLAESGQIVNHSTPNDPLTNFQNGVDYAVGSRYFLTDITPVALGEQDVRASDADITKAHNLDSFE